MPTPADRPTATPSRRVRTGELRGVLAMVIPMVITVCSRMVMDICDFKMIGYLGDQASAAQGAILPAQVTLWTFIVLGFGTVLIIGTFVSQSLGRQRLREASAYTWQGFYIAVAYGLLGLGLYPLLPMIFALMGHSQPIQHLEVVYARVAVLTIAPTIAAEAIAAFFNGIHRPKVAMWSAVESNVINIGASAILIFGLWGAPRLGIAGAAWGTLIGTVYRVVRLLAAFTSRRVDAEFGSRRTLRPDWLKLRAIARVGLPSGAQAFSDVLVWTLFTSILVGRFFGSDALVASNVAFQYMRISFMPAFGIGSALSALVGRAIGQNDNPLAMRYANICVGVLMAYLIPLSLIYLSFRSHLIAWFNTAPVIVGIGSSIMICAVVFQLFDGLLIAYHSALRGAGDTFWPAVMFAASHWLIVIGGGVLVALLRPDWGCLGPWWAATSLLIFLGLAMSWRWHGRRWQRIDIFSHERTIDPLPSDAGQPKVPGLPLAGAVSVPSELVTESVGPP